MAPARYYPVALDLAGKPVLVVGGGAVAESKLEGLLDAGARVTIVSPTLTPGLARLNEAKRIVWHARAYEPADVDGAWIVIAASDRPPVNAAVARDARAAGRLVNSVDDVPNCDFIATSVIHRGDLQVSISTGGGSPAMARWLREALDELLPAALGPLLDTLAAIRRQRKADGAVPAYPAWRRAITADVLRLFAAGDHAGARCLLEARLAEIQPPEPAADPRHARSESLDADPDPSLGSTDPAPSGASAHHLAPVGPATAESLDAVGQELVSAHPLAPVGPAIAKSLDAVGQDLVAGHRLDPAAAPRPGTVYLVGAGPGDPGLLTLRAARCLGQADVVVVDRLVDESLLDLAQPTAELIDVGKIVGQTSPRQSEINAILIERARRGERVVRLKGGDPFIFGRGGEEMLALAAAGIPFEVIPGVSSALAAPACAGIPVTHRDLASSVTVLTGHSADGADGVAWEAHARSSATLVILMGMAHLPAIVARLRHGGRPASEPVAVIQNASRPDQRVVTATLADVVARVAAAGLGPPSVIVVGPVAALAEHPRPRSSPLAGERPGEGSHPHSIPSRKEALVL